MVESYYNQICVVIVEVLFMIVEISNYLYLYTVLVTLACHRRRLLHTFIDMCT